MLHFSELYPFPSIEKFDYLALLRRARRTICIENNARGQFAMLMRMETGYQFDAHIHRFDGRPFTYESFLEELRGHI